MGCDSVSASDDGRDEEDDDDEYEEADQGNRLLGFMFGNVDNSGDLDIDYLDEDAKEHLAAVANKLGRSLTDLYLSSKSPQTYADGADQDYDKKAVDAVDFEDIDEQYEGPETQAATEEDFLLPKTEFLSAVASGATLEHSSSVFDDEDYDEEEEDKVASKDSEVETVPLSGEQDEDVVVATEASETPSDVLLGEALEGALLAADSTRIQEESVILDEPHDDKGSTPLPVLCIEDGVVILRFSEIFGVHEPLCKGDKRDKGYSFPKEKYEPLAVPQVVEEDEEAFLKGAGEGFSGKLQTHSAEDGISKTMVDESEMTKFHVSRGALESSHLVGAHREDYFLRSQAMKENVAADHYLACEATSSTFYPLDQLDWEDAIIWDDYPETGNLSVDSCSIEKLVGRVPEHRMITGPKRRSVEVQVESDEKSHMTFFHGSSFLVEAFDSSDRGLTSHSLGSCWHPQLLRLESRVELDDMNISNGRVVAEEFSQSDAGRRFRKVTLRNRDIIEGSWLEKVIWDSDKPVAKQKLIIDLQDEEMLFDVLDVKNIEHLRGHAGAMIRDHSMRSKFGDSSELPGHGGPASWRFNIANDKFYLNRKTSQQQKSYSKKRTSHGVKVLHSIPALKLQTMKPKLSFKDMANFHRPKTLWYPHDNEVAMKVQGMLLTHGPMKIILKSLGGKGCKLNVDAEETVSSVKSKASKKLDFKPSEIVRIFYAGSELEDDKSLAVQNVRPNSLLHLVRTKIHLLPRAQKVPGENRSLRPPGAFKKKSDLSVKDGHVFLVEYCEERPLLLGNIGMGARLCTYYQKLAPSDQTATQLRTEKSNLGTILALDPADKSPFIGEIRTGCSQSCLETNMYRAPIFHHKVLPTDYLLVRTGKGKLSIRRIDRVNVVGQQEPHMEVMSPGTKGYQTYIMNRLLVYMYREFGALEKRGMRPCIRADELSALFPNISESFLRKRLKHCADLQRSKAEYLWVMRPNFRLPLEEELRRIVTPESVCTYESMQAGLYKLKRLGISKLTHPTGLSAAMNQLPDEAIALAAASHIERELQITPWNLSCNFVSCTNQNRENIERLEITGVGDPSGRGLGFSYVRAAPKAPISTALLKRKTPVSRANSTVTGTDADLRRLSMDAAREVLLKFNVPDEQIAKQTRWHRIAMIRKLSSEQASLGVKVDPTTLSKYARGQRMSFLQLQQQTREKCQEIWDRQVESLSAIDGDENESDSEANSDLDSFAGDLENLLDAEEFEDNEEGNFDSGHDRADSVRGLKMRRHKSQVQAQEEIEDEAAEAAELCRLLMDDDEPDWKKKRRTKVMGEEVVTVGNTERTKPSAVVQKTFDKPQPYGSYTLKEDSAQDSEDMGSILSKTKKVGRNQRTMKKGNAEPMSFFHKKVKIMEDGNKIIKERKSARESFACGACGQLGHMRTNKNCPKYGEDVETLPETADLEKPPGHPNLPEFSAQSQQKPPEKSLIKLFPKPKSTLGETFESENPNLTAKLLPVKFKCRVAEDITDKVMPETTTSDQPTSSQAEIGNKSAAKVNKIIISNKLKVEDVQHEPHKPSVVIKPPADTEKEQPRKKIIIKKPKEVKSFHQSNHDGNTDFEYRKTKKIVELSGFKMLKNQESTALADENAVMEYREDRRWFEEEEKRRISERDTEESGRRRVEQMSLLEEQQKFTELRRYEEDIRRDREEEERQKAKRKKKKKKPEFRDDYLEDSRIRRNSLSERERNTRRRSSVESTRYYDLAPPAKRRRGGEVGLANILEGIVEALKNTGQVAMLFLKPVSKKEAPDYLTIVKRPMDLSTIKEKVRRMEYKHRDEFRHDVWQIAYNAHLYNDRRNPHIPPLADQLLEICEHLLEQRSDDLSEAEASIEQ